MFHIFVVWWHKKFISVHLFDKHLMSLPIQVLTTHEFKAIHPMLSNGVTIIHPHASDKTSPILPLC